MGVPSDGNKIGSDRVECLGNQNRNPNLKLEPVPNTDSDENSSPKPKPTDTRNPIGYPKLILYGNIVRAINNSYKHIHNIYNIHKYN